MMRMFGGPRRESGQSLVEFALVLPIVILIMIGVFDLGRIVFVNNSLSDGARHGARTAIINPRDAGVKPGAPTYCKRIEDSMRTATLGTPLKAFQVTYQVISPTDSVSSQHVLCNLGGATGAVLPLTAGPGDRVLVQLEADVTLATPLVAAATGQATFNLKSQSTMQVTFVPAP